MSEDDEINYYSPLAGGLVGKGLNSIIAPKIGLPLASLTQVVRNFMLSKYLLLLVTHPCLAIIVAHFAMI